MQRVERLMETRDEFLKSVDEGKVFFFAGSGVSYLSHMASVGEILHRSARKFLPLSAKWTKQVGAVVGSPNYYRIQPEIFYEKIVDLAGTSEALALWKCLSPNIRELYGLASKPNINHLFLVKYSFENKVPIFTTNFDCLFERAADELGYKPRVIEPSRLPSWDSSEQILNEIECGTSVFIFKLHGTISDESGERLDSIFTTMRAISTVNRPLLNIIKQLRKDKHIVFLGYSGRDIDYFPEIRAQTGTYSAYWIDRFYDPSTMRSARSIKAQRIDEYPNELFSELNPSLIRVISIPDCDAELALFDDLADKLETIDMPHAKKLLLLAMSLQSVGRYRDSHDVLLHDGGVEFESLIGADKVLYLLALSKVLDCLSDYISSADVAERALRHLDRMRRDPHVDSASRCQIEMLSVVALHQKSLAQKLQLGPTINYGGELDYRPAMSQVLSVALEYIWTAARMRSLFRSSGIVRNSEEGSNPTRMDSTYSSKAASAYLDHWVIIFAGVEAAVRACGIDRLPIVRAFLSRWLEKLEIESSRSGDYFTRSNVRKYAAIVNGGAQWKEAEDYYKLLNDPINGALVCILKGKCELEKGSDDSNQDARALFAKGYVLSMRSGTYATALKALVGLYYCGSPAGRKWNRYSMLQTKISSHGYARYFSNIKRILQKREC